MNILALPIFVPLLAAAACLLVRGSGSAQRAITGIATHVGLAISAVLLVHARGGEVLTLAFGGWPDTFGIVFALDVLAAMMLVLSGILQVITFWFLASGSISRAQQMHYFHPLFLILIAGVNWAFLTSDLFNLFVSFELILLCSYALMAYDAEKGQVREATKFVVLNVIAGTLFLAGAGLVYGTFGSLNMADLAIKVRETDQQALATALGTFLLIVFGIKAALFPLFFWLPNSYPKAPLGILPFFAGMLTKVGVYVLYRMYTLVFHINVAEWFQPLLLTLAGLTMLIGVLAALSQWSIRHILSVHIISQVGYMIFGLGLFTALGLAGGLFSVAHNIVVKTTLFLVAGVVIMGAGTDRLKEVGGVLHRFPVLSVLFLLAAFSLAGIPPLSGFFPKYALVLEGFHTRHTTVTIVSIVTSLFTLASMVKIWTYVFLGTEQKAARLPSEKKVMPAVMVTGGLAAVTLLVAVFSGWTMDVCHQAATQLLEPVAYIEAIRGPEGAVRFLELTAMAAETNR